MITLLTTVIIFLSRLYGNLASSKDTLEIRVRNYTTRPLDEFI